MSLVLELETRRTDSKVLLVLASHAPDIPGQPGIGFCFPSIRRICWESGYSRRPVQKSLRRLESAALIFIKKRGTGRCSTQYEIHLEHGQKKVPFRGVPRDIPGASPRTPASVATPVSRKTSEGCQFVPPHSPLRTEIEPKPLATTLFSPAAGSPNNNVFETYISEVGKIFAHLPGAIPSRTDRQIVERWFASKVAIPTVKLGLVEGMLRHISGPNYDRTLNLAYFVPIVEEYAKSPRAVPPHLVDFRYTRLADYLKERPNFPRASWMIPELEEAT